MKLTSKLISTKHGFFTYDHDDKSVSEMLGAKSLVRAKQTHSNTALYIKEEGQYEADALITDISGIAVGVVTADCAPILLYDENVGVVAAIHAGWKGARFGIIEATLDVMKSLMANDVVAAIGPCIQQKSYEVGEEFFDNFLHESNNNKGFFRKNGATKYLFDLPAYVKNKLEKNGIEKIDMLNEDTLSQPEKFCSYRRSVLSGKNDAGRQISAISL